VIHGQNLNLSTLDAISHDIRIAAYDEFMRASDPSSPTYSGMILQLIDGDANTLRDFKRSARILPRNIVLDSQQCSCGRRRPTNAHDQASLYLLKIASISASEANRPASADLIPSLMRSSCQASNSRYWSMAWLTR